MTQLKKASLAKYVESLKQRLSAPAPPKHQKDPSAFKQMLELDLKKTLAKIERG